MFRIVRRRNGESLRIPVDEDGYVPQEALEEHNAKRSSRARTMDSKRVSKKVLSTPVTPEDAADWWVNPGRSDIEGIDAPSRKRAAPPAAKREEPRQAARPAARPADDGSVDLGGVPGRYYANIDEGNAKIAYEYIGWGRYQPGSETRRYRERVDAVYDLAEDVKSRSTPELWPTIDDLARSYADRLAGWINSSNANRARYPSSAITGPSKYNRRVADKQSSRSRTLAEELTSIESIPDRIREYGRQDRNVRISEPGAASTIERQIGEAEAEHARMKTANAYYRKHGTLVGAPGFSDGMARLMDRTIAESGKDRPYDEYDMSSARDKVKRLKAKGEQLSKNLAYDGSERAVGDITVIEDTGDMMIRLVFPDVPSEQVRSVMKSNGFRWSPKNGAWQRELNDNGRAAAETVLRRIGPEYGADVEGADVPKGTSQKGGGSTSGRRKDPSRFFGETQAKGSAYKDLPWLEDPFAASMIGGEDLSPGMVETYLDRAHSEVYGQIHGTVDSFDREGSMSPRSKKGRSGKKRRSRWY